MLLNEIVEWIKVEYLPLQFSIPDQTLEQNVRNAYRYFNNNSAVKTTEMVTLSGSGRVQVSKNIKAVANVLPASLPGTLNIQDFPLWSLLGIQVIDNLNSDLMMLTDTYKNYSIYMGKDFQWTFQPDDNPGATVGEVVHGGGYLYADNIPAGTNQVCVIGAKRIFEDEDVTDQMILDFLLRYSKALCMVSEGNVLRKSSIIGINNDGQEYINEAKEEIKNLQQELSVNGRWMCFGRRI